MQKKHAVCVYGLELTTGAIYLYFSSGHDSLLVHRHCVQEVCTCLQDLTEMQKGTLSQILSSNPLKDFFMYTLGSDRQPKIVTGSSRQSQFLSHERVGSSGLGWGGLLKELISLYIMRVSSILEDSVIEFRYGTLAQDQQTGWLKLISNVKQVIPK